MPSEIEPKEREAGSLPTKESGAFFGHLARWAVLTLLVALAVGILCLGLASLPSDHNILLDFTGFYAAGEIVNRGTASRLYDLGLQAAAQKQVSPWEPFIPYVHAPLEALLFAPLARLSFSPAFLVWSILNMLVLGLSLQLLMKEGPKLGTEGLLIWLAVTVPAVGSALAVGQDSLLLLALLVATFIVLKRGRERTAGMLLGLGLFRFEIVIPLALIFLVRRRWRFLGGFCIVAALVAAGSMAMIGWGGTVDYARLLMSFGRVHGAIQYGQYPEVTAKMPCLRGLLATLLAGTLSSWHLFLLIAVGSVALLGWASWQFDAIASPGTPEFDLQFSFSLVAVLLVGYHVWAHELDLLIPVAYWVLAHRQAASAKGSVRDYSAPALLLLFPAFQVIGPAFNFLALSVLAIVMLGLCVWLAGGSRAMRARVPVIASTLE